MPKLHSKQAHTKEVTLATCHPPAFAETSLRNEHRSLEKSNGSTPSAQTRRGARQTGFRHRRQQASDKSRHLPGLVIVGEEQRPWRYFRSSRSRSSPFTDRLTLHRTLGTAHAAHNLAHGLFNQFVAAPSNPFNRSRHYDI